jgi:hypothetical protein
MGSGASALFFWRNKKVVRRPIYKEVAEILKDPDALERIWFALGKAPPGTKLRWQKLQDHVNRTEVPTEENPDPVRLKIDIPTLKLCLQEIFQSTKDADGEGLRLVRKWLPEWYAKHTFERAKRVSQFERNETQLTDDMYAYAEMDYNVYISILEKCLTAYGRPTEGFLFDLGAGCGQLVFASALTGNFKMCGAVENVETLLDRGSKRMVKWDNLKGGFPQKQRECKFVWAKENFLENPQTWVVGNYFFLHWTAFSLDQRATVAEHVEECSEGSIFITLTNPIEVNSLEILIEDWCETSWGRTKFFVHEKMTPAKKVNRTIEIP